VALQKSIQFKTVFGNVAVNDVYIKVDQVTASKESGSATLRYFKGKEGALLNESRVDFPVDIEGKNFIAQAYDHIKTLSDFVDSVDC
jgi:TfoX/Sxy family transcriptional regulator of competence genes